MTTYLDPRWLFSIQEINKGIPLIGISGTTYPPTAANLIFGPLPEPVSTTAAATLNALIAECVADAKVFNWTPQAAFQPPTLAIGTGMGTGATCTVTGSNQDHILTIKTGTKPVATGVIINMTFFLVNYYPLTVLPTVIMSGANGASVLALASNAIYPTSSLTGYSLTVGVGSLPASTALIFNVHTNVAAF